MTEFEKKRAEKEWLKLTKILVSGKKTFKCHGLTLDEKIERLRNLFKKYEEEIK